MTKALKTNRLEDQLYYSSWQDGLLDLCAGLGLLLIGISWLKHQAALGAIAPALMIPVWMSARKRFVEPRAGHVEFRPERLEKERWGRFMIGGVLTFSVIIAISVYGAGTDALRDLFANMIAALPGVILAIMAVAVGAMLRLRRFFVYGAALVIGGIEAGIQDLEPGWYMAVVGLMVTITGIVMFVRFLQRNPLPGDGA